MLRRRVYPVVFIAVVLSVGICLLKLPQANLPKRTDRISAIPNSSPHPATLVPIHPTARSPHEKPSTNNVDALESEMPPRNLSHSPLRDIQAYLSRSATEAATAPFNWVTIGPANPSGGLAGRSGKLQAFAWEASHPLVMYAGGGNGSGAEGPFTETGVFKTTDGGNTWISINNGLSDHSVNVLWIDDSNPQNLLAGGEFGGIFRTSDGGSLGARLPPTRP